MNHHFEYANIFKMVIHDWDKYFPSKKGAYMPIETRGGVRAGAWAKPKNPEGAMDYNIFFRISETDYQKLAENGSANEAARTIVLNFLSELRHVRKSGRPVNPVEWRGVNWELGDSIIARQLGITRQTVFARRKKIKLTKTDKNA